MFQKKFSYLGELAGRDLTASGRVAVHVTADHTRTTVQSASVGGHGLENTELGGGLMATGDLILDLSVRLATHVVVLLITNVPGTVSAKSIDREDRMSNADEHAEGSQTTHAVATSGLANDLVAEQTGVDSAGSRDGLLETCNVHLGTSHSHRHRSRSVALAHLSGVGSKTTRRTDASGKEALAAIAVGEDRGCLERRERRVQIASGRGVAVGGTGAHHLGANWHAIDIAGHGLSGLEESGHILCVIEEFSFRLK